MTLATAVADDTFPPVLTKADFVDRYLKHEFGNHSPSWGTLEDFTAENGDALRERQYCYHLRNRIAGGFTHYYLTAREVVNLWSASMSLASWYCSLMVPPEVEQTLLIQGEVQQTPPGCGRCGLDLYYSTLRLPMRPSLEKGGKQASGVAAQMTLQYHLCPNSYEWLQTLLQRYPYHVIEFSTYAVEWGTIRRYNTVVWEVRLY